LISERASGRKWRDEGATDTKNSGKGKILLGKRGRKKNLKARNNLP